MGVVEAGLERLSTKFTDTNATLLSGFPTLSFEDLSHDEDDQVLTLDRIGVTLQKFKNRFMSLKTKWAKAFSKIEANHVLVVKDLDNLQHSTNRISSMLGVPASAISSAFSPIWEQLQHLTEKYSEQLSSLKTAVETSLLSSQTLSQKHEDLLLDITAMEEDGLTTKETFVQRFTSIETTLKSFDTRFTRLLSILNSLRSSAPPTHSNSMDFMNQLHELNTRVTTMQETLWSNGLPAKVDSRDTSLLEAKVLDIQAPLTLLQHRIAGDGVQIRTRVFQSFDDVQTWVTTDLPNRRYGLFVDAVSLLDFFTSIGHVDAEKTFSAFYNQHKTGFSSIYEARVAASVQNLFPMVFGCSVLTLQV